MCLLITIKFKTFQDYFVKFEDFKALNLVQSNSRIFKTFMGCDKVKLVDGFIVIIVKETNIIGHLK